MPNSIFNAEQWSNPSTFNSWRVAKGGLWFASYDQFEAFTNKVIQISPDVLPLRRPEFRFVIIINILKR